MAKKRQAFCLLLQDSYSYVRSTAPAVAYDSKQYYQQPVATPTVAAAAAQPQPTVAESYYQTGMLDMSWHLNGKKCSAINTKLSCFCFSVKWSCCFLLPNVKGPSIPLKTVTFDGIYLN